jgi:CheY-like chemotaxis protein
MVDLMKQHHKIFLGAKSGPLYQQATKAFPKERYKITTAARRSLKSVVETIELEKPDVILLDLVDVLLPAMSGTEVLDRIRGRFPDTPVILEMSAQELRRNKTAVSAVTDIVVEPYEPAELLMRVERCVWNPHRPAAATNTAMASVNAEGVKRTDAGWVSPSPSAPPTLVSKLHDRMTGRIDARKLAEYLDIPLASLARSIGKDYKAVFKTPASDALQPGLAPIHRTAVALHRYFGRRTASLAWLNTVRPELDSQRPKDLILQGKATIVADMLEGALAGVTS